MVADALGKRADFKAVSSEQRSTAFIGQDEVNFVISTFSITQDRMDDTDTDFIGPYAITGTGFLQLSTSPKPQSKDDLRGRTVCTWDGTTSEEILKEAGMKFASEDKSSKCVERVMDENDEVDAVFSDELLLQGFAHHHAPELTVVPSKSLKNFPDDIQKWGIALPKGHRDECEEVKQALKKYVTSGGWDESFVRNFGKTMPKDDYKPSLKKIDANSCVDRLPR